MKCPACGQPMEMIRTCLRVYFRCGQCQKEVPLDQLIPQMDDDLEEHLGAVRCDRL